MFKIIERTVCGGIEVKVKKQKTLTKLFKKLAGSVEWVSDKGAMLSFPSEAAKAEYMQAAKANGAIFDSASDYEG